MEKSTLFVAVGSLLFGGALGALVFLTLGPPAKKRTFAAQDKGA